MTVTFASLDRLDKVVAELPPPAASGATPASFPDDPVGYAERVLGIATLTDDQKRILRSLLLPPRRTLVPSGHTTGKTFLAAVAINWWYDSHDPGAVFTIGPRFDSLSDTIWGEVRRQRFRAGLRDDFAGPKSPHMETSTDHWAKAFTANKDASLTGRHFPFMLFVIEEACAVDPIWWEVIMTMFDPSLGHAQLCIFNPTDPTSQAYQEDQRATDPDGRQRWHRIRLDATRHPNVICQLRGEPKAVRHAVSLEAIEEAIRDGCEPVMEGDRRPTDMEWPPADVTGRPGKWYRPGPIFQARWLGLWPDAGAGVWSPALFEACLKDSGQRFPVDRPPQLGCDCSTGKGDDYFALHGRWGAVSVHHETSNTMDPLRIFERVKAGCGLLADLANKHRDRAARPIAPKEISVKIDDDGTGNAVAAFLRGEGYLVATIGAGEKAQDENGYPNKRSELWFRGAAKAKAGLVDLSRLDRQTRANLRQQLLSPTWKLDGTGRRVVEPKEKTKEKIGRSPDDADAFNLAMYDAPAVSYEAHAKAEPARGQQRDQYRREELRVGGHHGYR